MAYQTLQQEYLQIPVVTRAYTTACVLTTAAVVSKGGSQRPLWAGGCPDCFSGELLRVEGGRVPTWSGASPGRSEPALRWLLRRLGERGPAVACSELTTPLLAGLSPAEAPGDAAEARSLTRFSSLVSSDSSWKSSPLSSCTLTPSSSSGTTR